MAWSRAGKLAVVGDDEAGAGADEAGALGGVEAEAPDLVAGNADGEAAALLRFADFDGAVAEGGELGAGEIVVVDDAFEDELLGFDIDLADRAEDAAFEEVRIAHELGFEEDVGVIGAAGEIELDAARVELFEEQGGVFDLEVEGAELAGFELADTLADEEKELFVVDLLVAVFVEDVGFRDEAGLADEVDEVFHLHQGLDAGGAVDKGADFGGDAFKEGGVGGLVSAGRGRPGPSWAP